MQDFSKFNCPHCGSDNTASMSLVYRRGHATGTAVHTEVVGYDVTTTIHTRSDGSTYTDESRSPCYGNVTRDTYTETDLAKEAQLQQALLAIKQRYGKNAVLPGTSYQEEATGRERNSQIGGHKA